MQTTSAPGPLIRIINDDLDALHGLLCLAARGEPPTRENAVLYAHCRGRLLASIQGKMLPGFLYQCATIDRFKEFIHLYDPETELRIGFIDRMIDRARPIADPHVDQAEQRFVSAAASWEF